jgi:hypothetical protein
MCWAIGGLLTSDIWGSSYCAMGRAEIATE